MGTSSMAPYGALRPLTWLRKQEARGKFNARACFGLPVPEIAAHRRVRSPGPLSLQTRVVDHQPSQASVQCGDYRKMGWSRRSDQ
jgi:hypothetical protein